MQPRHLPLALSLALVPACQLEIKDLTAANIDSSPDQSTGISSSTGDATTAGTETTGDVITGASASTGGDPDAHDVDILFVIDNSGSMAPVQKLLASGIPAMVDTLDASGVDFRIAVTTTDSGNPRCPNATYTPEVGDLVISSCMERIADGEFNFNMQEFSDACFTNCAHAWLKTQATTTDDDPVPAPRPWLEKIDGNTNLDVPIDEAAACLLPQGVAGCGFEQPLESMYNALVKAAQQGFLRDHANLLVVLVTDEVDCSYNPAFQDIFTSNKAFWNDPSDPAPTSAMCWRAGTACSGGPGTYDECHAVDRGADGMITDDPDQAVLHPISRYKALLEQIEADKNAAGSQGKVFLNAVVGVPAGYQPGGEIPFADAADPNYQADFGIGPGCSVASEPPRTAVPPLRIKELVESVPHLGNGLYSICDGALKNLPKAFGDELMMK